MDGPGESLRQEREARGRTIEEMAEATGIRPQLLTALEQESFDSLPGRGFGKLYIRAYAEVLGFDPRPVIEAYDRAVPIRQTDAPTPTPARPPRPVKAALERWRQERMAGRAEGDLSAEDVDLSAEVEEETFDESEVEEEPFDRPEEAEREPEPERFQGVAKVDPGLSAMAIAAGLEGPAVQPVPPVASPAEDIVQDAPALPPAAEAVAPPRPTRGRLWPLAWLSPLVLLPLVAYLVFFKATPDLPSAAARHEPVPGKAVTAPPALPPPRQAEAPGPLPRPQTPVREPSAPSALEVTESGLGRRFVGTRLEGEGDRFRSGQRVTFATRVAGGGAGESIRHVWLRDGKVEQSIRLSLGGRNWRTYSTKTLGRPGAWAVEAHDERGNVLARADFDVTP